MQLFRICISAQRAAGIRETPLFAKMSDTLLGWVRVRAERKGLERPRNTNGLGLPPPSFSPPSLPCISDVGMMLVPTKCVGGRKNYQAHEEEEPRYAQIPHKDVCSRSRSIYRCCCIIYGLRSVWVCRVSTSKFPLGGAGLINQADIAAAGKRTTSLSDG